MFFKKIERRIWLWVLQTILTQALSAQTDLDTLAFFECKKEIDWVSATTVKVAKDGRIWVEKHANGLWLFDGSPRKVVSVFNGLPSNIVQIVEDNSGKMWYFCPTVPHDPNRIGIIENGKVHPVAMPDSLSNFMQRPDGALFFFDGYSTHRTLFSRDPGTGAFQATYRMPPVSESFYERSVFSKANPQDLIVSHFDPKHARSGQFYTLKPDGTSTEMRLPFSKKYLKEINIREQLKDGTWIVADKKALNFFKNESDNFKLVYRLQPNSKIWSIYSLISDPPDEIWLPIKLTEGHNQKKYCLLQPENGRLNAFAFQADDAYSISRDRFGYLWISGGSGGYRLNPRIRVFEPDEKTPGEIWSVAEDAAGMYYFGSYGSGLTRFDGKRMLPAPEKLRPFPHWMSGSVRIGNEVWMPVESGFGIAICQTGGACDTILSRETAFLIHHARKDGSILLGLSAKGMLRCPPGRNPRERKNWHYVGEKQGWRLTNTLDICQDNFGQIWGCRPSTGLAVYNPSTDTAHTWLRKNPKKDYGGMCLQTDSRGNIWFGTTRGLRFFHPKQQGFDPLRDLKPIAATFFQNKEIKAITLFGEDTLLVVDEENRLVSIDLKKFYLQNEDETGCLIYYPEIRDLDGEVVQNSLFVDTKRNVWLPLVKKLVQFRLEKLLPADDSMAALRFDSLVFSGGSISLGDTSNLVLPKGARNCVFHFSPLIYCPGLFDSIFLTVDNAQIFKGLARDFRQTSISFTTAGLHEIRLAAIRNQTVIFEKKVALRLPYRFNEHPAFLPAVFLLLGGILAGWFYNRKKFYKKLSDETSVRLQLTEENRRIAHALHDQEKLLGRLRINALVNQLNPHFLKNSLHWMQTRVFKHDPEVAEVIRRLAESLKNVVESSEGTGMALHPLTKEMQLVENYLTIQKCLFPRRLRFEISGDELLDDWGSLPVPLMSIQIFVENAMIHGIENRAEGGGIFVRLREKKTSIEVEVDDEGVGFVEGARIAKEKGRKSSGRGMSLLNALFDILNRQNKEPIFFKTTEKTNPDGSAAGVTVLISFPKNLKHETK